MARSDVLFKVRSFLGVVVLSLVQLSMYGSQAQLTAEDLTNICGSGPSGLDLTTARESWTFPVWGLTRNEVLSFLVSYKWAAS